MKENKFTVDYFIEKFEAIPEEKWCEKYYNTPDDRFCALGHCGFRHVLPSDNGDRRVSTDEGLALMDLFSGFAYLNVWDTNDGREKSYPQLTPKARILAALRDIKAKQ